jgi:hypothetical protein
VLVCGDILGVLELPGVGGPGLREAGRYKISLESDSIWWFFELLEFLP